MDSFKYLGVVVDAKLNFKSHYSELRKNVNRKVQYFGRASNNLNMNTRIKVYRTIISPGFSYCPIILYFGTQENIDKLQLLQNRCLRIILKWERYTSISNMLQYLGLMNVKDFLFLQTMCFVSKLYPRQLPADLNFTLVNEIHDHETRAN